MLTKYKIIGNIDVNDAMASPVIELDAFLEKPRLRKNVLTWLWKWKLSGVMIDRLFTALVISERAISKQG